MARTGTLGVDGTPVPVSNLDKILYPAAGFTKAQVIDYYIRAAEVLLPHLHNRPVTLKRYPDGVTGEHFYEKDAPAYTPKWVDPGEGAGILTCAEIAVYLRDALHALKLKCFAKVSGSKGIQVYVPFNTPVTYAQTQPFAKTLAQFLEKQHPSQALERIADLGDLFEPVLTLRQKPRDAAPNKMTAVKHAPAPKATALKATAPKSSRQGSRRRFVIQLHAASHLHYDFRFEMHGVLKSWAVPKGVPHEPGQRRLAAATEDHPLEYIDFEGTIPKGQHGGGAVLVWDTGTWELIEGSYNEGRLQFFLNGEKVKGEYLLEKENEENWRFAANLGS